MKLGAKRDELVLKFVKQSHVEHFTTNAPDPPHWTIYRRFGVFVLFGCIWDRLVALQNSLQNGPNKCKFVPRSCVGIFRNKSTRSTGLYPKLTFWCVLRYFGAFGTVWWPYETRCKTGQTSAKVCASKSLRNFSQRTHPIHPIGPQTNILVCFILFGCIRDHLIALRNRCKTGRTSPKVHATNSRRNFLQRTHPIHPHGTLN